LIRRLKNLAAGGGLQSGNLTGMTSGQTTALNPITVPMSDEAKARFRGAFPGRVSRS
jgi:hypothetical protein